MDKTSEFHNIISNSTNIFITAHIRPDADAISSGLGMYDYLTLKYPTKNIELYMTGDKSEVWDFLHNSNKINWVNDIKPFLDKFDTLIFLDGNSRGRFTEDEPEMIDLSKFKTICLDHHPNQPDAFDLDLSDTSAASATQLVYKLFFREEQGLMNKEIAQTLMLGILADTGTFKYLKYSNSETFILAKEILDIGQFDIQELELHLTQFSEEEFAILQILMINTQNIELADVPPLTYTYLPLSALAEFSVNSIKNAAQIYKFSILRQVKKHNWGFIVTPDAPDQLGISFRSTPGFPNVQTLAKQFNGGGHFMAAGGSYEIKPGEEVDSVDVCQKILEVIKTTKLEAAR